MKLPGANHGLVTDWSNVPRAGHGRVQGPAVRPCRGFAGASPTLRKSLGGAEASRPARPNAHPENMDESWPAGPCLGGRTEASRPSRARWPSRAHGEDAGAEPTEACCRLLRRAAGSCGVLPAPAACCRLLRRAAGSCGVLPAPAACCRLLRRAAGSCVRVRTLVPSQASLACTRGDETGWTLVPGLAYRGVACCRLLGACGSRPAVESDAAAACWAYNTLI